MASTQPPGAVILTSIDDSKSFYLEGKFQGYCASCRFHGREQVVATWEVHHGIAKQTCRREGAPLYSPDNALRLCAKAPRACHERHTSHQERLPMGCLRDENIAFAAKHLEPGPAYVYFQRHYQGSDPRVDALLGQSP